MFEIYSLSELITMQIIGNSIFPKTQMLIFDWKIYSPQFYLNNTTFYASFIHITNTFFKLIIPTPSTPHPHSYKPAGLNIFNGVQKFHVFRDIQQQPP